MDLVIWSPSVSHNIIQMIFQTIDFWSNQWKFSIYNDDRWWPILIFSEFHYQNFVIFFWFFVSFLLFQMEQQQKPIANQPIFESKKKTSKLICLFFAIFDNLWPNVFFPMFIVSSSSMLLFRDWHFEWSEINMKKMVVVASLLLMFFLLRMISPLSKQKEKRKITLEIVFLEWYFWSGFEKIIIFVSLSLDFDFSE